MAHNLNFKNGKASMFFVREEPWHGFGTKLSSNCTAAEAIAAASLGYRVQTVKVHDPDMREISGFRATMRDDTREVFSVVSDRYTPIQNVELAEFADAVVGTSGAFYHTAGALGKGNLVWFLLEVPKELRVGTFVNEQYKNYLFLFNSHDGSRAMRALNCNTRVVCQNTVNAALREGEKEGISIRHIGNVKNRVDEAKRVLGFACDRVEKLGDVFTYLVGKNMTEAEIDSYVESLLPIPPNVENPRKIVEARAFITDWVDGGGTGLDEVGIRGTRYSAYQAAIEWFDHVKTYRNAENRMKDICFGGGIGFKTRALELLLAD